MKDRPTSVTVFAVINLILAGLGVIGIIFWIISKLGILPQPSGPQGNPVLDAMQNNQAYQLFTDISTVLGIIVTILLIAASIGMFTLKPWARMLTIGYGLYSILITIVALGVNYIFIFGPIITSSSGPERIAMTVAVIFQVVIGLAFISYYLLMIFMLSRPHVVDAFTPDPWDDNAGNWDSPTQAEGTNL